MKKNKESQSFNFHSSLGFITALYDDYYLWCVGKFIVLSREKRK